MGRVDRTTTRSGHMFSKQNCLVLEYCTKQKLESYIFYFEKHQRKMFSFVFERQLSYFFPTAAYRNLHCVISHKLKLFQNTKMYVFNLNVLYIIFWSGLHASSLTFGLFSHTVPQLRASRKLHETASIPVFFFFRR